MNKKCTGCQIEKDFSEFSKSKSGKFGLHNHCRACAKANKQKYYQINREKEIQNSRAYSKSPEGIQARQQRYAKDKERLLAINRKLRKTPHARKLANIARNKRYRTDINFKISINTRSRIRSALKNLWKSANTIQLLGCSIEELKTYIQAKFLPGMSWANYGYRGWHLDHIIPCASFNLIDPIEQAKCFHYTNLQPLWWRENISKGDKIIQD